MTDSHHSPRTARQSRPERPAAGRPTFAAPALATSSASRVPFVVLLAALVLGGMGLLLLLNTASAANEVSRQHYAESDTSVSAQVALLRDEVAASAAPGNLARAAAELGMVPGGNPAFLVVGADGKVTVRGSAAPASEVQVQVPKAKAKHAKTTAKPTAKSTAKASTKSTATPSTKSTAKASTKSTATPSTKPTATPTAAPTPRTGGHR